MIPVRCQSCGKPIAQFWEEYQKRIQKGEPQKKVLDDLHLTRYCCRSIFLGHVDLIDSAAQFKKS
ncbi:MAG: DNA-directed RNA polymerase subunit N [Nanoarchaeota archaeon]